jgi:very-short-patch-repair endonuclease
VRTIINPKWSKERRRELRQHQTQAEEKLWDRLRDRRCFGVKFKRQVGIGPYIADFYSHEYRLAIELDGPIHATKTAQEYDAVRDGYFKGLGIVTLRFQNAQVFQDDDPIAQAIGEWTMRHKTFNNKHPSLEERGKG